ncbi:MAG: hypothetical protein HY289_01965 [Planctomycetes bacterium]|nr:hypothetical protein [Planctomycetota bacterium]
MSCVPIRTVLLVLCAIMTTAAANAGEKDFKPDARLVGSWEVSWVRGNRNHRVAGFEVLNLSGDGTLTYQQHWRFGSGSYTLTADGIDITISAIGAKMARGIYRFDGENLILCVNAEDAPRPKAFELPAGDGNHVLLVLQRSPVKHRKKDEAAKLAAEFKKHADEFEITIARAGYDKSKIDLNAITLYSSNRKFAPWLIGPSGEPIFKSARITKEQALKLIDALDQWPAHFFNTAQDKAEPLRERPPYFFTHVGYGSDAKPGPQLHLAQDFAWHTIAHTKNLGDCVDGEAAKLIGEIFAAIRDVPIRANVQPDAKPARNLKVLLVNGKPAEDRFATATEYLSLALNPFRAQPGAADPKVRPRTLSAAQFDDPVELARLKNFDCIFLCDVPSFSQQQTKALETFVKNGGGLVISLGARVDLEAYNAKLYQDGKGLLPVKLLDKRDVKRDHTLQFAVAEEAFKQPPLAAFNEQVDRLTLFSPRFHSFIRISEPAQGKARIVATFEEITLAKGGKPSPAGIALLECRPYAKGGRVVLLTSTVNMDWTNWPGSPSFLPMVHELVQHAVDRDKKGT